MVAWAVVLGLSGWAIGCSRFEPLEATDVDASGDLGEEIRDADADGGGVDVSDLDGLDAALDGADKDGSGSGDAGSDAAQADATGDAASGGDADGGPPADAGLEDVAPGDLGAADGGPGDTQPGDSDGPDGQPADQDADATTGADTTQEVADTDPELPPDPSDAPTGPDGGPEVEVGPACEVPGVDCPCTLDEECIGLVTPAQCQRALCAEGVCEVGPDSDANGLPCSDGSGCTGSDHCTAGACVGQPFICNDGNPCTADSCDESIADCVHVPLAEEPCNDGDVCTFDDACTATGQCAGAPVVCPEGPNPCVVPTCSHVTGVCNLNTFPGAATACGPPDACGSAPSCNGAGACSPATPVPCEDDGVDCTSDVCDGATGGCVHLPIFDGEACGPAGDACYVGPVCQAGVCRAGHPLAFHATLPAAGTALGVDLVRTPDGLVALSILETAAGDSDALLQFVTTDGTVTSSTTYGSDASDIPRALLARPLGGYAFVGLTLSVTPYQGWVVFTDGTGNTTAQYVTDAPKDLGLEAVVPLGDDVLVAGTVAPATAWWARVSEQAGIIEVHTFEELPLTLLTTAAADVGGGYVLGGFVLSGSTSELLLIDVDDAGDLVASHVPSAGTSAQPTALAIAADGTRVIAGFELAPTGGTSAYVWRVTPGGQLIDATPLGTPGSRSLYSVAIAADGTVLAGGRAGPGNGSGPGWLVSLQDAGGTLIPTVDRVYEAEQTTNRILGLVPEPGAGAWLLGTALGPEAGLELPWLGLITPDGEASCTP